MKTLRILLAAAVILGTGAAQAGADHISFETAIMIMEKMPWSEKVELVGAPLRKKCRKNSGCVYTARMKSEGIVYSVTERRGAKADPYPSFQQWCVEEVEEQRMRCDDQK
jgi:hypothetical protein